MRKSPERLCRFSFGDPARGGKLYQKRLQIRGELRKRNMAAMFSEEIQKIGRRYSLKAEELFQASAADFIIVIQSSAGNTAEVHDFAGLDTSGRKMLIFIDKEHVKGFSYRGALKELKALYNNVHTYSFPRDIDECHLLGAVLKRVEVLQLAKWRSRLH